MYKLYVPSSYDAASGLRVPMVMMLHGCTQSPDDFATGTRMNALAERHGFLVVYPAQSTGANASRCWNWFQDGHQHRDRGEPSILAGITREVASSHHVDPRRVFVAGMSAGAAMAVVLATTYPDLYAAVGAHSGLPYGAASDMPSALAAMRRGSTPPAAVAATASADARRAVPTITFHGDRDTTVNVRNSGAIVGQALAGRELQRQVSDAALAGRPYERVCYTRRVRRAGDRAMDAARRRPCVVRRQRRGLVHRCGRPRCLGRDGALFSRATDRRSAVSRSLSASAPLSVSSLHNWVRVGDSVPHHASIRPELDA